MTTRAELNKMTGRAKELAMVQEEDLWPHWPFLPLIRRDRSPGSMDLENCGLVLADRGPTIYPGNLIVGPTRGAEPIKYPDWDGLLDEWAVD